MEGESEAVEHLKEVRSYRKELAQPLHNPESSQEEKDQAIEDLRAFRELNHEDPDYRQALRIISEIRGNREINKPEPQTQRIEYEFPQELEERYAAILSSIVNNAGKQITFLSIPNVPGTVITLGELHKAFVENSGDVWRTTKNVQKGHALKSLIPIGMVAKDVGFKSGMQEELVGFTQTEAGKEYGDPIAKFLLRYAAEHNISLEKILGATSSSGDSRAPYNRAKALEYLMDRKESSNIRITDLEKDLGFSNVTNSLTSLQKKGLVIFDSVNSEKTEGKFTYSLNPEFEGEVKSQQRYNLNPVLQAISALKEQGVKFEIDSVLSEIQKTNPEYKRGAVQRILSDLASSNYLIRNNFKAGETQSTVTILQDGERFVKEVLIPIRTALTDTSQGEELRREWKNIPWQIYAPKALEIHKDNSLRANQTDHTVLTSKTLEIISENPGIRSSDIKAKLEEQGLPHKVNVTNILRAAIKSGEIVNLRKGKATEWYLAEEDPERPLI